MTFFVPTPFYTAFCKKLGKLYYFKSLSAAEDYKAAHGGWILQTSPHPDPIFRVAIQD